MKFSSYKGVGLYARIFLAVLFVQIIYQSIDIILYALGTVNPRLLAPPPIEKFLSGKLTLFISTLIVAFCIILLLEIPGKRSWIGWWQIILMVVVCYPGSIAISVLYRILRNGFDAEVFQGERLVTNFAQYPSLMSCLLVYGILLFWARSREEHENALKARSLMDEAKWKMLRYQVNPHFLFNSLNSIMALINRDKDLARSVVNELASYFRYTLSWNDKSVIPLAEEINAVTHYLEIQKIRFEDRLCYSVSCEKELEELQIPIFSLQTLVENAVKYGLKSQPGPVTLKLSARIERGWNLISVSNTGRIYYRDKALPSENNDGTGSGLTNLKARLDLMYPGLNNFSLVEQDDNVIAEIRIAIGSLSKL